MHSAGRHSPVGWKKDGAESALTIALGAIFLFFTSILLKEPMLGVPSFLKLADSGLALSIRDICTNAKV